MDIKLGLDRMLMAKGDEKISRQDRSSSVLSAKKKAEAKPAQSDVSEKSFSDLIGGRDINRADVKAAEAHAERESSSPEREVKERSRNKTSASATDEKKNDAKPVTKRAAMEIFLKKMEDQLGVEPEQVLQAFAELSVSELVATPEETATQVVDKLKLSGDKKVVATDLYNQMLAMTAAASMAGYLEKSGQQANVEVLTPKEAQTRALRASLDKMNNAFFLNGTEGDAARAKAMQMRAGQAYQKQMSGDENSQNEAALMAVAAGQTEMADVALTEMATGTSGADAGFVLPQGMESAGDGQVPTDVLGKLKAQASAGDAASASTMPDAANTAVPNESAKFDYGKMLGENAAYKGIPTEAGQLANASANANVNLKAADAAPMAATGGALGAFAGMASAGNTDSGFGASGEGEHDGQGEGRESAVDGLTAQPHELKTPTAARDFMAHMPKATTADLQANVKEIISQAQFLARDGGGEMKIQMSPEGMGHVNLKVSIENGQVNVEMLTSNDETKKLLEKGLADLKESLAHHKLSLESIKIDAGKDLSNQLADHKQNMEQGYQQKFLNDFREKNSAFRRDFFEMGGPRRLSSQIMDDAANAPVEARKKRAAGRRLDLVA